MEREKKIEITGRIDGPGTHRRTPALTKRWQYRTGYWSTNRKTTLINSRQGGFRRCLLLSRLSNKSDALQTSFREDDHKKMNVSHAYYWENRTSGAAKKLLRRFC